MSTDTRTFGAFDSVITLRCSTATSEVDIVVKVEVSVAIPRSERRAAERAERAYGRARINSSRTLKCFYSREWENSERQCL